MAEQISHNAVEHSESTLAPRVGAATSQPTVEAAPRGAKSPSITNDILDASKSINELSNAANGSATKGSAVPGQAERSAEPSAGDAASKPAQDTNTLSTSFNNGQRVNNVQDNVVLGDGTLDDRSVADGSDTDTGRGDKKDDGYHMRTNSVKKPTTFSKVTASKNFLAKTATPPPPSAPKPGEKALPTAAVMQPTAKPRLVAKTTGPSLRELQKARAEGPNGPDASKVWNKNRPVAPAPPRQFTDEELKQQYGIHMATRLQTDESGKESKWADIDEEDDWVPEQVVWMDGTKSTLTPQDAVVPPKEEKPIVPPTVKPLEVARPTLANMKKPESTRTILKPGVAILAQKQNTPAATSASPGPEKSSLKASSPAPPSKSPWAPVPKVESISPINPPTQQPAAPTPLAPQDARAYEPQQLPHSVPAREIAADTFERSWRDGEGAPRELFNSTNGRYEPAPEGRRTGTKTDANGRKPSVLQRPSHSGNAPAEPSAAFQSRSAAQTDSSWSRRRGSSVSQGSIPAHRRMSMSKSSEISEAPESRTDSRPAAELAKPKFAQQSPWDQQVPALSEHDADATAPIETQAQAQERIMREKIELAKKRREAEAAEEAAKQERLRAKLASLEGHGISRAAREAEAAAAAKKPQADTNPSPQPPPVQEPSEEPAKAASSEAGALPVTQSLAPPPGGSASGQSKLDEALSLPSPIPAKYQAPTVSDRADPASRQGARSQPSPQTGARALHQQPSAHRAPTSTYPSPGDRKPQPFGRSQATDSNSSNSTPFMPWGSTPSTGGSVWGLSGIGNGAFEAAVAPSSIYQQSSPLPPPPSRGLPPASTRISPQNFDQGSRSSSVQPPPATDAQSRVYAAPSMESRADAFGVTPRLNGVSQAPGAGRPAHPPGPIAPPSRAQQQPAQRPDPISAWQTAAKDLPTQRTGQDLKSKEAGESSRFGQTINHTFKKTSVDQSGTRLGGPRKYDQAEYHVHDGQGSRIVAAHSPIPPPTESQPLPPHLRAANSPAQEQWKPPGEGTVRVANVPQHPAASGIPTPQPPIGPPRSQQSTPYQSTADLTAAPLPPVIASKDPSPPPPETESHPVNTYSVSRPHVKLPPNKPTVKLPPSQVSGPGHMFVPTSQLMMPPRPQPSYMPPGASRPIADSADWQARFNGLFHKTQIHTEIPPSPPKTPPKIQGAALPIASFSRAPMEYQSGLASGSATVSLPLVPKKLSAEGFVLDDSQDIVSKPAIEQIFDEELEFGSQPPVRVPKNPGYGDLFVLTPQFKDFRPLHLRLTETQVRSVMEPRHNLIYISRDSYFLNIPNTRLNNKPVRIPGTKSNKDRKLGAPPNLGDRRPSGKFNNRSVKANKDVADAVTPATPAAPAASNSVNQIVKKGGISKSGHAAISGPSAGKDVSSSTSNTNVQGEQKRRINKPYRTNRSNRDQRESAPAVST